ncbi:MAG: ubiquinone/menaquinone biosynthesis methyltransferase, partial [Desulfobacteraceae bacterium]
MEKRTRASGNEKPVLDTRDTRLIREMFSGVTSRYDFLNRLLSLRRDVAWRRAASRRMRFFRTFRLLDIAAGTCDIGIQALQDHPGVRVVALDLVEGMLKKGRDKALRKEMYSEMDLIVGDALHLPFPDECFDVVSTAFGIRNFPDRRAALAEMARVAVPGGRVVVLEMALPEDRVFRSIYRVYLRWILPRLARVFSPHHTAYQYLSRSIMDFPAPAVFADLMSGVGLGPVSVYSLNMGISYLHV